MYDPHINEENYSSRQVYSSWWEPEWDLNARLNNFDFDHRSFHKTTFGQYSNSSL